MPIGRHPLRALTERERAPTLRAEIVSRTVPFRVVFAGEGGMRTRRIAPGLTQFCCLFLFHGVKLMERGLKDASLSVLAHVVPAETLAVHRDIHTVGQRLHQ